MQGKRGNGSFFCCLISLDFDYLHTEIKSGKTSGSLWGIAIWDKPGLPARKALIYMHLVDIYVVRPSQFETWEWHLEPVDTLLVILFVCLFVFFFVFLLLNSRIVFAHSSLATLKNSERACLCYPSPSSRESHRELPNHFTISIICKSRLCFVAVNFNFKDAIC